MRPRRPRAKRVPPPKSDWSPRAIPQAAEPRHTADSVTPPLRELAERARSIAAPTLASPPEVVLTPEAPPRAGDHSDQVAENRTASRICAPIGVGDAAATRAFVRRMRGVQQAWPSLAPEARLARVQDVVNTTLQHEGVPPVPVRAGQLPTGVDGGFFRPDWALYLNKADFGTPGDSLSDQQAGRLAQTVLHEARHAEQAFLVARRRAAQGADSRAIAGALGTPSSIADAARARPLPASDGPGTPNHALNECARVLDVSLTGTGWEESKRVYNTLGDRTEAAKRALAVEDAASKQRSGSSATQAAYDAASAASDDALARADRTQALYEHLPHEADSFAVAARVLKLWR